MLLNLVSGLAVLFLTEWLLLTASLSVSDLSEQYYVWAPLVVLLWAQPWSARDRYRTGSQVLRWLTYLALILLSFAHGFIFARWAWLIALEAAILAGIEGLGRRAAQRK